MAFDESLYVTAKFTTARGLALSKQSNALTIKDTSKNPTYTAGFFTDNLANTPMSSVGEDGTAYIVLITTGVPDNTYLDWEITGAGITLDDTGASMLSGQAMIRTNEYWATIKPKLDLLTEGDETLTITFKRDGVVVASASIVINDTSNGSIGDIGFYRHQWGSDANLMHRRVYQTYVGSQIIFNSSGVLSGSSFTRSGISNGYKWECSNKAKPATETIGGPVINALLSDTTLIYGDGTNVVQSITLNNLVITNQRPDGVDYKSITIVIRNKTKGVNHTFTFYKGITYMDQGTYGSHTAEFKALRARIEAIGTYRDQVEIESVTIT